MPARPWEEEGGGIKVSRSPEREREAAAAAAAASAATGKRKEGQTCGVGMNFRVLLECIQGKSRNNKVHFSYVIFSQVEWSILHLILIYEIDSCGTVFFLCCACAMHGGADVSMLRKYANNL